MTERPSPPTPEPAMRGIARAEFGPTILPMCKTRDPDYAQFSLNQMHDFCRADRLAAAPAAQPEDLAEQYIAGQISRAPEPLRQLGDYLSRILDEDEFKTAERYVLGAIEAAAPAAQPEGAAAALLARLREAGNDYTIAWGNGDLYDEAADEIERLQAAAAQPPTPVKTGPHDVEAVNAGMQQAAFDASRSVDGLGFKSLHHAGHKERDRWCAVVNAVTKIDRKTQAEGFWSDK